MDVDVCYEVTYGQVMMPLSKQLPTLPQSMLHLHRDPRQIYQKEKGIF